MRNDKIEAMDLFLTQRIAACQKEVDNLTAEVRTDESVLAVLRQNIYDIFHTILSVAEELCGEDEQKFCEFFQSKAMQIPENWQASLMNARAQNDAEQAHMARIKMETVVEIQNEFSRIWGLEG